MIKLFNKRKKWKKNKKMLLIIELKKQEGYKMKVLMDYQNNKVNNCTNLIIKANKLINLE